MDSSLGAGNLITGFLFLAVLLVVPFWRLLPRHGIPKGFALLAVLPVGAVILLWIMAFRDAAGDRP